MPPDALAAADGHSLPVLTPAWKRTATWLGLAWLALIVLFRQDWSAMAAQWWNSSTYNHILFVPAIVAWLVWQRLPEVLQVEPHATRWGLVPFALAVLGWVLGGFAALDLLRQAAVVAMLPAAALLLLGPRSFASVLFPMVYLAFLVPFGDELVPPLQTITAELTIGLTRLSGVPAVINGVFIDTPAGLFEVAEACSGVKFLVAMVALGALVANIGFRSWKRRGWFMVLCVIVPIVANGIRAWATIFAAQYVGAERAAGIDHLIYGWIFFGLVIAAVLALSWRHFDRAIGEPACDAAALTVDPRFARWEDPARGPAKGVLLAGVILMGGLAWSQAAQGLIAPIPRQIHLPDVAGWERTDFMAQAAWEPQAAGADHRLLGSYASPSGQRVEVFYALYADQGEGREAAGFGQGALVPGGDWSWASAGPLVPEGRSDRLVYLGATERLAFTWYRSGALLTGSKVRLKLANIADRVALRPRATAVLILSAERSKGNDPQAAIAAFSGAIGPIGPWMDQIGEGR